MSCCASATIAYTASTHPTAELDFQEQQLLHASSDIDENLMQTQFTVPDMHCVACIGKIERGLAKLAQVKYARANLSLKRVTVVWDKTIGSALTIDQALSKLGFDHTIFDVDDAPCGKNTQRGRELLIALAVAGFAAANVMLLSVSVWSGASAETAQLFHMISGLIAVPTVVFSGKPFFKSAWSALRVKRLNMDVPISLAVLLALAMSFYESLAGGKEAYFDAAVTLLFFLLIGRYLDHLMRQKARGAVEQLSRMSSRGAVFIDADGNLGYVTTNQIAKGMVLRLKPGERFPVDGEIVKGSTDIDRSLVTGESANVFVEVGERVEAGSLNLTGLIDIKATSTAKDSFLAEMQKMMEVAENGRSQYVRIADRMAQIYAPAVHLLALITFIGWMIVSSGDVQTSLYYAIAVLIVTCPCALGLAVPVAHVIGANRLMQQGILMRDGSALERLAEIDNVVFDKTGTLTTGTPIITEIKGFQEKNSGLYKAMASSSSHPFSKAILDMFDDADEVNLFDVVEIPGLGVEAKRDDKIVRFGKPSWVSQITVDKHDIISNSAVALGVTGGKAVIFQLEDSLRNDAKVTIENLKESKLGLQILSGDAEAPVFNIATAVNIDDFQSNQTPTDKIQVLERLKGEGSKTLMVGDGLNDAPSLASAHVSMAPASACDIGRLAADFIFVKPSLSAIYSAHQTAITVGQIIKQNFAIALVYNCIAVPMAMMGYVTPLIAALAMSGSSIAVIANSMRINIGYKKPEPKPIIVSREAQLA